MQSVPGISFVTLFLNADIVVKGVLLVLLAASVWSWAVIVDKLWRLGAVSRSAQIHEARAAAARSAGELWDGSAEPDDPAAQILVAGIRENAVEAGAHLANAGEPRERRRAAVPVGANRRA